jgi:leader peptidase (prepilin peptidase)/N-methyltransferase
MARGLCYRQARDEERLGVAAVWIVFLFAIGACVGSFLNVVIYRLPRGESIIFPGSHCPACGVAIKWYDNIPLVSWAALRGRCRSCKGPISPRYLLIELLAAVLVSGLYVCYFVLRLRDGLTGFAADWPLYIAHAALLCGLLASSAVDIERSIVPLPVMWVCAGVGIVAASFRPPPPQFMPTASPTIAAISIAAIAGLIIAKVLLRLGWIQESFVDADDRPERAAKQPGRQRKGKTVAITAKHGVNPRVEVLRELLFLAPAIVLAVAAYYVVTRVQAVGGLFDWLFGQGSGRRLPQHLSSGMGAVFGMLVGGACIWATRILGTLAFGKEAMGMGDVHILAATGAVAGWIVPTLTFFAAPLFGLIWALYLAIARGRRELPYGPWLALGVFMVLLFYDAIVGFVGPGAAELARLFRVYWSPAAGFAAPLL